MIFSDIDITNLNIKKIYSNGGDIVALYTEEYIFEVFKVAKINDHHNKIRLFEGTVNDHFLDAGITFRKGSKYILMKVSSYSIKELLKEVQSDIKSDSTIIIEDCSLLILSSGNLWITDVFNPNKLVKLGENIRCFNTKKYPPFQRIPESQDEILIANCEITEYIPENKSSIRLVVVRKNNFQLLTVLAEPPYSCAISATIPLTKNIITVLWEHSEFIILRSGRYILKYTRSTGEMTVITRSECIPHIAISCIATRVLNIVQKLQVKQSNTTFTDYMTSVAQNASVINREGDLLWAADGSILYRWFLWSRKELSPIQFDGPILSISTGYQLIEDKDHALNILEEKCETCSSDLHEPRTLVFYQKDDSHYCSLVEGLTGNIIGPWKIPQNLRGIVHCMRAGPIVIGHSDDRLFLMEQESAVDLLHSSENLKCVLSVQRYLAESIYNVNLPEIFTVLAKPEISYFHQFVDEDILVSKPVYPIEFVNNEDKCENLDGLDDLKNTINSCLQKMFESISLESILLCNKEYKSMQYWVDNFPSGLLSSDKYLQLSDNIYNRFILEAEASDLFCSLLRDILLSIQELNFGPLSLLSNPKANMNNFLSIEGEDDISKLIIESIKTYYGYLSEISFNLYSSPILMAFKLLKEGSTTAAVWMLGLAVIFENLIIPELVLNHTLKASVTNIFRNNENQNKHITGFMLKYLVKNYNKTNNETVSGNTNSNNLKLLIDVILNISPIPIIKDVGKDYSEAVFCVMDYWSSTDGLNTILLNSSSWSESSRNKFLVELCIYRMNHQIIERASEAILIKFLQEHIISIVADKLLELVAEPTTWAGKRLYLLFCFYSSRPESGINFLNKTIISQPGAFDIELISGIEIYIDVSNWEETILFCTGLAYAARSIKGWPLYTIEICKVRGISFRIDGIQREIYEDCVSLSSLILSGEITFKKTKQVMNMLDAIKIPFRGIPI